MESLENFEESAILTCLKSEQTVQTVLTELFEPSDFSTHGPAIDLIDVRYLMYMARYSRNHSSNN